MRVLFTTTSWKGAYFCMVPLAWALQAAGHQVRLLCAPHQAGPIGRAGLVAVPVARELDVMRMERFARYAQESAGPRTDELPLLHPYTGQPVGEPGEFDTAAEAERFWSGCAGVMGHNADAAVRFTRDWRPDLVVHDLMTPEGALAARVAGVPSVFHSPGMFGTVEDGGEADLEMDDPSGAFARHGVGPWDRTQIGWAVDPSPPGLLPPFGTAERLPMRYVPYNGPGAMPLWALERPKKPRICLIWGNSATAIFGPRVPALRHAVDAVVASGAELVLTAGPEQVAALGALPDSVRLLEDFPLHLLLPASDAIIHQGSVNPLMTAAAAGVPQLVLGLTDDQRVMGGRFAEGGSALVLPGLTAGPDDITQAVGALLESTALGAAAVRIASGIATRPTPAHTARVLAELAAAGLPG
ncbi:nucleotide disphospho-sugar-binding domain-containing protein [Streptomyces sp. NPDC003032]